MATCSSILAWRVPRTAGPGSPQSIGVNPWVGKTPGRGDGHPLQHPCLESPTDSGAWRPTVHGGHKEADTT